MNAARLLKILGIAMVAGVVTYVLAGLIPKTYSSSLTLYFPMSSSGGGAASALIGGGAGGDSGAVSLFNGALGSPLVGAGANTALGLISSRTCRLDVAKRLKLDQRWKVSLSTAAAMLDGMIVPSIDKSGFLQVRVNGSSPALCRVVADQVYAHLNRRSAQLTLNVSAKNRQFVEQRRDLALRRVVELRGRLVSTMSANQNSDPDEVVKQYEKFRQDLADARVRLVSAEAKFASLDDDYRKAVEAMRTDSSSLAMMGSLNAKLTQLTDELQGRRLKLEDTLRRFSDSAPEVRKARQALASAQKVANSVLRMPPPGASSAVSPELMAAKSEVAALRRAVTESENGLARYEKMAASSPEQYARVRMAKEEFEQELGRVGTLNRELEVARIAEARDPSRFEVIDQPFEDPAPVAPKKSLFVAVVFVLALFVQFVPAVRGSLAENPA